MWEKGALAFQRPTAPTGGTSARYLPHKFHLKAAGLPAVPSHFPECAYLLRSQVEAVQNLRLEFEAHR